MPNYSIIATTFSDKHNFRVGNNLVKAVKNLNLKNLYN